MPLQPGKILKERFRIEGQLGKGGMGAVYLAYDQTLELRVAIKENLSPSPESERQFKREAILLARLRHPNLPRVSDHFIIEDRQYLVMDYIEGEDLQTYASQRSPSVDEVLTWADAVCNALTFLHTRQPPIIHRDIKPANIKLQPDGTIVLVDFGIAKEFSQATTTTGARGLTPGFSPPEQYGLQRTDAISDQYSLAATIYALLTGDRPADSFKRLLKQGELKPARDLNPEIPEHVEAALQQALALQKVDRFPDIEGFRTALREQAPAEVVFEVAQPAVLPSRQRDAKFEALKEQAHNLAEEEKWDEALATWREYLDLEPEDRLEAEAETKRLEQAQELALAYAAAQSAMEKEKYGRAVRTLKSITIKDPTYRDVSSLLDQAKELRHGEKRLWQRPWLWGGMGVAIAVALIVFLARSPIPNSIIAALTRPTAMPPPPPALPTAPIITSRSSPLPTSTPAPILTVTAQAHATELANIQATNAARAALTATEITQLELHVLIGHTGRVNSIDWSPDGGQLASVSDDLMVRIWDAASGREVSALEGHEGRVNSVAWSPDGAQLATASEDGTVRIWEVASEEGLLTLIDHEGSVNSIAWSPDGMMLASGGGDGTVRLWSVTTWEVIRVMRGHADEVNEVAWSPNGSMIATVSEDGIPRTFDVASGDRITNYEFGVALAPYRSIDWSPDGSRLVIGGATHKDQRNLFTLSVSTGGSRINAIGHTSTVHSVSWSPDGSMIASASEDMTVRIWDVISEQEEQKHAPQLNKFLMDGAMYCVDWSPDGTKIAFGDEDGTVRVWQIP